MSLYYEAADLIDNASGQGGSLKSRVYGRKGLKSSPSHLYALIVESRKWSSVLSEVIEKSDLLKHEKKLTPVLALLLSHDLLLAKRGVACTANHVLKLAINRHKARLSAELTKTRLKRGFSSLEALRAFVNATGDQAGLQLGNPTGDVFVHPRWIRINSIKSTLESQLLTTFASFTRKTTLREVLNSPKNALYVDEHVPNLVAVHPSTDLSRHPAYLGGEIIFQDKASCFPAYLLGLNLDDGDVVDACAAPGNKTTHLAAIVRRGEQSQHAIFAFERNKQRSEVLSRMLKIAGATDKVTIFSGQDFLEMTPNHQQMGRVTALLLDPSCSGSGIVGRDDDVVMTLPVNASDHTMSRKGEKRGKKRKLNQADETMPARLGASFSVPVAEENDQQATQSSAPLHERLKSLSDFQVRIVEHAMQFPAAKRITYSTCSVHAEENEHVVLRALASQVAVARGWRIMRRSEQVSGMMAWDVRGDLEACRHISPAGEKAEELADACIRCEKGTDKGTMGFFVAGFVRDAQEHNSMDSEEEWEGFSGDEHEHSQHLH